MLIMFQNVNLDQTIGDFFNLAFCNLFDISCEFGLLLRWLIYCSIFHDLTGEHYNDVLLIFFIFIIYYVLPNYVPILMLTSIVVKIHFISSRESKWKYFFFLCFYFTIYWTLFFPILTCVVHTLLYGKMTLFYKKKRWVHILIFTTKYYYVHNFDLVTTSNYFYILCTTRR